MRPARMSRRRRDRSQRGFTLVELMVSLVMFSFAIAGVLAVAVAMANGFREQRETVTTEGTSRAAITFMADAVRGASPGVPAGALQVIDDAGCATGAVSVTANTAPDATDKLHVVFSYGSVFTTAMTSYDVGTTALTVADASELSVGDTILISNFIQGSLVKITGKSGDDLTLASQTCGVPSLPAGGYPPGSTAIRALRAEFFVAPLDGIPTLWMDPDADGPDEAEPLAEGIEDLQIVLGVDSNGDNQIAELGAAASDDEWEGNVAGDSVLAGAARAVRITLVARDSARTTGAATFFRPAAEDHAGGVAPDNFRRRLLSTIVEIRNLAGSP